MAPLPEALRRKLEKTVVKARDEAEKGARAALGRLAVGEPEHFATMSPIECYLRERLCAHAHQLGDPGTKDGKQEIQRLVSEFAYEHWHRMLFARFLAENRLLIHSEHGVPVTLAECEELAAEEGEEDGWALAGRFAARMLPAIFRPDDPVLSVRLAPENQQELEKLLAELPTEVFTADDSLGWVYQFWQAKRKKAVNKSGVKIGADELPAVTQLFTEPYMVHFLLHNTLGAWWAGKALEARPELVDTAASEEELRSACAIPGYVWSYLRFIRPEEGGPWRPAAGTFEGWPDRAAEVTVLDPCCGSGHFLVEAFRIMVALRTAEEGLSVQDACDAVLRENLFGLEIDERCTQIAVFNLALAAWVHPDSTCYRPLPELHIACSGLSVGTKEEEWLRLAGKDDSLRQGMRRLYHLFKDAPTLGSLVDPQRELQPTSAQRTFHDVDFAELQPLLDQALAREEVKRDARAFEAGIAAQGLATAAAFLAGAYTLVVTNVPYLGRGKQDDTVKSHLEKHYAKGKADLSTAFVLRCLDLCAKGCSTALVTPQNWLFLTTYTMLREELLKQRMLNVIVRLGSNAFQDMNWWAATTSLVVLSRNVASAEHLLMGLDVSVDKRQVAKAHMLCGKMPSDLVVVPQSSQLKNPDARFVLAKLEVKGRLSEIADSFQGTATADDPRAKRHWWEFPSVSAPWTLMQTSPENTRAADGLSGCLLWGSRGDAIDWPGRAIRGTEAWGKIGVGVANMSRLPVTLYHGRPYDQNLQVVIPKDSKNLAAVWCYLSSPDFRTAIRNIDQKLNVTTSTIIKIPFDLAHWQRTAAEKYPNGLPEPESDDPTQWLFHGRPEASTAPLQVGVARLLGYCWPAELDKDMRLSGRARELVQSCDELLSLADADGIVCIPPLQGELSAAGRLQKVLAHAFGTAWTPATLPRLLDQVSFSGKTLEDYLRNGFFEQHSQLFDQRPFIWHVWDGRRDGFAALVNCHKLDRRLLERLTYTVIGGWITHQRQGVKGGELGAADRLAAAEALQGRLALILEGEPPYDIFVRWKPLAAQPIGWDPDLNDGVRMNIRPFVEAGVLRKDPRGIKWTKDRGAEPQSLRPREEFPWFWKDGQFTGERVNDTHLTNAEKRAARAAGEK